MKSLLRERFGNLNATGRFWMWAGLITLACSMGMAYDYGSQVSFKHGLIMGALSFATAFIVEEAYKHWKLGLKGVAVGMAVVSIPMFWQETKSHIAYTAGFRGINIETAEIQKTRYDGALSNVNERQALLAKHSKDLAALEDANAWAITTTATALRAQLATAQKAIDLETARGGCKAKCLARMEEKADLEGKIAKAEQRADLTKQIADLKAELSTVREKADKVEHKPSIVQHQNSTLVKLASMMSSGNLESSPFLKEVVEQENTIGLALMPVILPALFFSLMGLYRKPEDEIEEPKAAKPVVARETVSNIEPVKPGHSLTVNVQKEDDIWQALHNALGGKKVANAA